MRTEADINCKKCDGQTKKFGKDRDGNQRYRCVACKATFSEPHEKKVRPLGDMILADEKILAVVQLLVEGMSVRAVERVTNVHRDTVLKVLTAMGEKCERITEDRVKGVHCAEVQADEIWGFVFCKEKTKTKKRIEQEGAGDAWTFTAIDRHSKLVVAWHLGRRTEADTIIFTNKIANATEGSFQITTDGFKPYQHAVVMSLGVQRVDFAQLVKIYQAPSERDTRYSPPECIGCTKVPIYGHPDMAKVSTSHVERNNLTMRMQMRRLTHLTNGFSKKQVKLHAMLSLYFTWYNFCRVHSSIRVTPAMETGLTDHIWTLQELISA